MLSINQILRKAKQNLKRGEYVASERLYRTVLDRFPQNQQALKALRFIQQIKTSGSDGKHSHPSQEQIDNLITLYNKGERQEVIKKGGALSRQYPKSEVLYNLLGAANFGLKRLDIAAENFKRALQLNPNSAMTLANYANVLQELRMPEQAIENYTLALALKPDFAAAHRNLSNIKKFRKDDSQIKQMAALLDKNNLPDADRIHLCFALAKAYGDTDNKAGCIHYLLAGNSLQKKKLEYDITKDRALFSIIKSKFSKNLPTLEFSQSLAKGRQKKPIFILGMPRSGSSLVEQIVAMHSQVYGAGEVKWLREALGTTNWLESKITTQQLQLIRELYMDGLADFTELGIINKTPLNFLWVGYILLAMPEAKIIHTIRDSRATCWSAFKHYFSSDGYGYSYGLNEVAEYYKLYENLMSFWNETFPGQIYNLNYEKLTESQEGETRKLIQYLDLDWENQCLNFHLSERAVNTASSTQVRQKMYQGSSEEWRKFEEYLTPMLNALEEID